MSTEINPKVVREIARKILTSHINYYAFFVGNDVLEAVGDPELQRTDLHAYVAWDNAVVADIRAAALSWPDEQPTAEQDADVPAVRAVVDAAGKLPIPQYESMPELAAALNALLEQFEDRIKAVDEAESLARVRAYKAKLDEQADGQR